MLAPVYNISTMDRHNNKSATLYDAGGWFLVFMFFGVAFVGLVIDYFWNYLILFLALRLRHIDITIKRKLVFTVIITAFGLAIDWLYYEITWGTAVLGGLRMPALFPSPGTQPGLEIATIVVPLILIGIVNYFASRLHLHLNKKNGLIVGGMMAVLTAPWLIVTFVLLKW